MSCTDKISTLALFISFISVCIAGLIYIQTRKSNKIARVGTLLMLKKHYGDAIKFEQERLREWNKNGQSTVEDGFTEKSLDRIEFYDEKYKEISDKLENYKISRL